MFNRRHFLKVSAAVTALSVIPPTAAVTAGAAPAIDWAAFCNDDGGPVSLCRPWFRNGYKIASDSRILVRQYIGEIDERQQFEFNHDVVDGTHYLRRIPCDKQMSSKQIGQRLAIGQSIYEERIEWRPWPYGAKPVYGFSYCPQCNGGGLVGPYVPCTNEKCHGPTAYLDPAFCSDCNENCEVGSVDCATCTGAKVHPKTGEPFVPYAYRFENKLISREYFDLISALPKPVEWFSGDFSCGLILYRGANFDGGVMSFCNQQTCGDKCDEHGPRHETAADFGLTLVAVE